MASQPYTQRSIPDTILALFRSRRIIIGLISIAAMVIIPTFPDISPEVIWKVSDVVTIVALVLICGLTIEDAVRIWGEATANRLPLTDTIREVILSIFDVVNSVDDDEPETPEETLEG